MDSVLVERWRVVAGAIIVCEAREEAKECVLDWLPCCAWHLLR